MGAVIFGSPEAREIVARDKTLRVALDLMEMFLLTERRIVDVIAMIRRSDDADERGALRIEKLKLMAMGRNQKRDVEEYADSLGMSMFELEEKKWDGLTD